MSIKKMVDSFHGSKLVSSFVSKLKLSLFTVLFSLASSCGSVNPGDKIEQNQTSDESRESSLDALLDDGNTKEETEETKVSSEFIAFQMAYTESIRQIMKEYYLYEFNSADISFTVQAVENKFFQFRSELYKEILSSKALELEYLAESATEKTLSDADKDRIGYILWELYYENEECSPIIEEICFLVLN